MSISKAEKEFYARQLRLPEVGEAGQLKLKNAKILLVGLGGLGSPLALYLAAAGVGRLGIVEFDQVDVSNLHRQVLYTAKEAGSPKLRCGAERLRALNPHIEVQEHATRFSASNARELVAAYDLVCDGADNFNTRYLVNDACVLENKALVSASILGFEGQLSVFVHGGGPCYRCLYPEAPDAGAVPSCAEAGVLGALPGVMGSLQATEALKLILGIGEPAVGRLLHFDALEMRFSELRFQRKRSCAACGDEPTIEEPEELLELCVTHDEISAAELRKRIEAGDPDFLLIDVREDDERAESRIDPSWHLPLAQVLAGEGRFPPDKEIIVYCAVGARSAKAAQALRGRGVRALNLSGGIRAWKALEPS